MDQPLQPNLLQLLMQAAQDGFNQAMPGLQKPRNLSDALSNGAQQASQGNYLNPLSAMLGQPSFANSNLVPDGGNESGMVKTTREQQQKLFDLINNSRGLAMERRGTEINLNALTKKINAIDPDFLLYWQKMLENEVNKNGWSGFKKAFNETIMPRLSKDLEIPQGTSPDDLLSTMTKMMEERRGGQ